MFQFGRFPSLSRRMTALEHRRVSPFGHLRLLRSYTPHRSFSQYNTSFIGTRYLGIHCVPLFAFRTLVRSLRLSWHAIIGITFALIIQLVRRTRRATLARGLHFFAIHSHGFIQSRTAYARLQDPNYRKANHDRYCRQKINRATRRLRPASLGSLSHHLLGSSAVEW